MKKILIFVFVILILSGGAFGFVKYKQYTVEKAVLNYLVNEENISKENITSNPFIANLEGNKNWMVSINIKGDSKTYHYYKNKENKIVLESYYDENYNSTILNKVVN